jgi:hypothetical protein
MSGDFETGVWMGTNNFSNSLAEHPVELFFCPRPEYAFYAHFM